MLINFLRFPGLVASLSGKYRVLRRWEKIFCGSPSSEYSFFFRNEECNAGLELCFELNRKCILGNVAFMTKDFAHKKLGKDCFQKFLVVNLNARGGRGLQI